MASLQLFHQCNCHLDRREKKSVHVFTKHKQVLYEADQREAYLKSLVINFLRGAASTAIGIYSLPYVGQYALNLQQKIRPSIWLFC